MIPEQPRRRPWWYVLHIGRMSLWLSWPLAVALTLASVMALITLFSDSSLEPLILTVWLVVTAVATPIVARRKGRRTFLWVAFTAVLLFLARFPIGIILQPLTALIAVTLGGPPPEPVDEEALEEDEDTDALAELERIRASMAGLRDEMEPLIESRDMTAVGDRLPELVAAENAVDEVPVQTSARGHRARVHLTAGIRGLQKVSSGAEGAGTFLKDNSDLRTRVAMGETRWSGKTSKTLLNEFKRIDLEFSRASRQLALSEISLDSMGYGPGHARPMPWLPPMAAPEEAALETDATDAAAPEGDEGSLPPDTRPRPVRGRRRQRY